MWQRAGFQGNDWHVAQKHVTLQEVHQILIEASVGGEAGDIAIDDLSFTEGACPPAGTRGARLTFLLLHIILFLFLKKIKKNNGCAVALNK